LVPESLIVSAAILAAVIVVARSQERRRRLELLHAERLAAIEKGIPLPELPLEPPLPKAPPDPRGFLFVGMILLTVGSGAMIGLGVVETRMWAIPLPVVFMGLGFMLFYWFTRDRGRR